MNHLVLSKEEQIRNLCRRHRVTSLRLFGSALRDDFEPGRSDIDLLVRFEAMPPGDYADAYFGLLEDLQELFGGPVDQVTESSLTNPGCAGKSRRISRCCMPRETETGGSAGSRKSRSISTYGGRQARTPGACP